MKKQELNQLKAKEVSELTQKVVDLKKKNAQLKPKMLAGFESNLKQIKNQKRDIAQILSIIASKEGEKSKQ